MKKPVSPYVVSFQTESFYKGRRYHWMICRVQDPGQLVSWGYEVTRDLAEGAAQREIQDLSSGVTQGGQVTSEIKPVSHRIASGNYRGEITFRQVSVESYKPD